MKLNLANLDITDWVTSKGIITSGKGILEQPCKNAYVRAGDILNDALRHGAIMRIHNLVTIKGVKLNYASLKLEGTELLEEHIRFGINVTTITLAYSDDLKIIYFNKAYIKALSKVTEVVALNLLMSVLTFADVYKKAQTLAYELDAFGNPQVDGDTSNLFMEIPNAEVSVQNIEDMKNIIGFIQHTPDPERMKIDSYAVNFKGVPNDTLKNTESGIIFTSKRLEDYYFAVISEQYEIYSERDFTPELLLGSIETRIATELMVHKKLKSVNIYFNRPCAFKELTIVENPDNANLIKALNNDEMPEITEYSDHFKCEVKSEIKILNAAEIRKEYEDDAYAQELYKQVEPWYDNVDLKEMSNLVKGYMKGTPYSLLFYGESGTGKSLATRVISHKAGIPYVAINLSVNIDESDMFGTMMPNKEKKSQDDPEFIWVDGIATRAIRNGYTLILEEINFANPGVLGKLNSLLDDSRQMTLSNGEVLTAHPNFRLIATCNIAYEGTNNFNKALINRFQIIHEYLAPTTVEVIKIIKDRTEYTDVDKIKKVLNVYDKIKKYGKDHNLNLVLSIRQLLTIFTQGMYFKTAYDAVLNIMVNSAFIEDAEYKEEFVTNIYDLIDLKFTL